MESIENQKQPLRVHIIKYIEDAILAGKLKPGDRIVETQIAEELNVSQTPVREALRELIIMGLLEKKPYSGTQVKKLSKKDLKDTYNVRMYLEMLAVKESIKHITSKDLQALKVLINKMKNSAKNLNMEEFSEYDIEFHEKIINVSRNSLLKKMWNQVCLSQWTFITTKVSKKSLKELAERHKSIYQSLKNKDSQTAVKNIKIHIKELIDEIINNFEDSIYGPS